MTPLVSIALAFIALSPIVETDHWLNSQNNTRHNRTCRFFAATVRGHYCTPEDGTACKLCGG